MAAALPLLLSGGAQAAVMTPGQLTVGSDITFPPYEYLDGKTPAGFDIEFINGVAEAMKLKPNYVDTRFTSLIPGLQAKRFELIASALFITPERQKVIDMVPYLKTGESLLTLSNASFKPTKPEELCGHKVGSMQGTYWLEKLHTLSADYCVKQGLKPITVSEFSTDPQTTQALLSHAVEVQMTDAAVASQVVDKMKGRLAVTSTELLYPVLVGLGVSKTNPELKKALNDGIAAFKASGKYSALVKKYHLAEPSEAEIQASSL
ncbi:ABC transporter substrate-binding protein [Cedecea neteri]|uniref:ABC transporter substrate-binding protein n=2 Tax=Cedecea neteri TaxID=158822 RepID=A0AAN0S778_9ENTR|nr:ABC transporter substrate-binding protein [Cedecea neteri]AIR67036.1 ABC transporter substrate-binding protein [Cedecea neteri]AJZ91974.1 ABC transporter substrate-binding protein [Klebsiella michiganensis]